MKYLFIILALAYSSFVYPSDTSSARYMPLKTGNSWTYNYLRYIIYPFYYETGALRRDMNRDTIINGKKYFFYHWYGFDWIRYDSLNGNLIFRTSSGSCSNYSNEKIFDSLASGLGDIIYCQHQATYTRECIDISTETVFNQQKQVKEFEHDGLTLDYVKYSHEFGVIDFCSGEPPPCKYFEWIKGCVIDGVVYGDTTLTDIQKVNTDIPDNYSLSQNYPNPFNPVTIINYELPASRQGGGITNFVSLKVYDILGTEVAVLVNEKQNAGSYEVEFDGSSMPSGIYFYTLKAGEFTETKRMILLK